jgi:hypothetical protein
MPLLWHQSGVFSLLNADSSFHPILCESKKPAVGVPIVTIGGRLRCILRQRDTSTSFVVDAFVVIVAIDCMIDYVDVKALHHY